MPDVPPVEDDRPRGPHLVANLAKVAVVVLLVVLLYLVLIRFSGSPSPVERVDLSISQDGRNWSVRFLTFPPSKLPSEVFVVLRDGSGAITVPRTSLENLTAASWSVLRVQYEKGTPANPDVQPGDRLLLDRVAHPQGSVLDLSDDRSILAIDTLR